ncbi:hypothetical protein [Cohnella abietis]|uniref:Uncharacterized protein n=1 Tax=Cohnella abietis TaxID=2507935 RepID=A0A3T1D703_9BACL|nr:hypothetical protein [Cohnella abietis]BBI33866.1 hypothetical protein KCTCHS21_32650 [Cohnella abietis]
MHRFAFNCAFTIYIAISGVIFLYRIPYGNKWLDQWIFDKFFVFQFMSVITIGLAIAGSYFNNLSYIRIGNRRTILRRELLGYYTQGFICVTIMFLFIVCGALSLREINFIPHLTNWYFRYLLGIILFINVMSCLKWSSNLIVRRYCTLIVFIWMALEILMLRPYIKNFYSLDVSFLFSWVFHRGAESYYWLLGLIFITTLLNIKISDKRDFI